MLQEEVIFKITEVTTTGGIFITVNRLQLSGSTLNKQSKQTYVLILKFSHSKTVLTLLKFHLHMSNKYQANSILEMWKNRYT